MKKLQEQSISKKPVVKEVKEEEGEELKAGDDPAAAAKK